MSTATEQRASTAQRSSFARVPAAFRLQFAVPGNMIGVPVMVFVLAWAIALGIVFWIDYATGRPTDSAQVEPIYTGASQAALWCLIFMAAYTATHAFPFSMALSFSRRVFVIGALLAFAVLSAGFGVAYALAAWVEDLTNGYGIEAYNFDLPFLTDGPGGILSAGLVAAMLCLTTMLVGFGFTIVYRRVGLTMFWVVIIALVVVLAAVLLLITQYEGWSAVGQWFMDQSALSFSGWLVIPTVVLSLLSYGVIRKTVPS